MLDVIDAPNVIQSQGKNGKNTVYDFKQEVIHLTVLEPYKIYEIYNIFLFP